MWIMNSKCMPIIVDHFTFCIRRLDYFLVYTYAFLCTPSGQPNIFLMRVYCSSSFVQTIAAYYRLRRYGLDPRGSQVYEKRSFFKLNRLCHHIQCSEIRKNTEFFNVAYTYKCLLFSLRTKSEIPFDVVF